MLWRAPEARGYFLGQLPDDDDGPNDAGATAGAAADATRAVGFDLVLEEAEPHLDRLAVTIDTAVREVGAECAHEHERPLATGIDEPDDLATSPTRPVPRTHRRRSRTRRANIGALA